MMTKKIEISDAAHGPSRAGLKPNSVDEGCAVLPSCPQIIYAISCKNTKTNKNKICYNILLPDRRFLEYFHTSFVCFIATDEKYVTCNYECNVIFYLKE